MEEASLLVVKKINNNRQTPRGKVVNKIILLTKNGLEIDVTNIIVSIRILSSVDTPTVATVNFNNVQIGE